MIIQTSTLVSKSRENTYYKIRYDKDIAVLEITPKGQALVFVFDGTRHVELQFTLSGTDKSKKKDEIVERFGGGFLKKLIEISCLPRDPTQFDYDFSYYNLEIENKAFLDCLTDRQQIKSHLKETTKEEYEQTIQKLFLQAL